jgi:molybdopterin converting factor subunit 1
VSVLYFAQAREAAGTGQEAIALPLPGTIEELLSRALKEHPGLVKMKGSIRVAVNFELVDGGTELRDGDEVAFLPPVAGG